MGETREQKEGSSQFRHPSSAMVSTMHRITPILQDGETTGPTTTGMNCRDVARGGESPAFGDKARPRVAGIPIPMHVGILRKHIKHAYCKNMLFP